MSLSNAMLNRKSSLIAAVYVAAAAFVTLVNSAHAKGADDCSRTIKPSSLTASDFSGFVLGSALIQAKSNVSSGQMREWKPGVYRVDRGETKLALYFTPKGRLWAINSLQPLRLNKLDSQTVTAITEKLVMKYGEPSRFAFVAYSPYQPHWCNVDAKRMVTIRELTAEYLDGPPRLHLVLGSPEMNRVDGIGRSPEPTREAVEGVHF